MNLLLISLIRLVILIDIVFFTLFLSNSKPNPSSGFQLASDEGILALNSRIDISIASLIWFYSGAENGKVHIFDVSSGTLENTIEVSERQIVGLAHHPFRNTLGVINDSGKLSLWKP
jgi:hypothetical protein